MNLNYELNEASKKLIDEYGENPVYCIPYDISREGNMVEKSFAVATSESIFIIQDEEIISKYLLSECENIVCESMVHCGLLSAKIKGEDYILCRFTNAWITQFSYFAQGAIRLKENISERVISHEAEKICPVCKRALPKTKECVKCNARGRFTKRILNMASPFKYRFIFLTLAAVLSTLIVLSIRFVERDFIDNFLIPVRGELNEILKFFSLILIMNATVLGLSILINRSGAALGTRISKNLRRMIYNKLQKSSLEFIHDRNPGELLNRIHQDTSAIRRFFQMGFSRIFSTFLSMVGALVIMGIMDFKITLAAMAMIPVILIISASFRKKIKRIFSAQWKFEDRANNQVADAVSGIRVIKAFGKEKQQIGEFIDINSKLADRQSKNEKFWAAFHPMLGLTLGLTSMIVILMSGLNVINGNFTIGQMGQFIAYTGILIGPLTWMSMLPRLFYHTLTSIERIYDVLEDDRVLYKSDNPVEKEILGDVEFKDVSFGYKVYEKVLDDISFKVGKGEMIGIVGYSGAGKSTLINLLIRLYDPDSGEITVDGFNIKNYEPANYHTQIGIVLQETFLFSGSILDNIKYSVPEATYDDVIKASKIANAHDFIVKFIDGYNTKVGEKGVNLSGGERQRIAIARAILGDPKIMVLDEATSSLDSETEFLIQEAVARLTKGRTTFVIAHRLSTLRKSDRIIVIDNNKIAEIGSHKELIRKGGIYYNLVKAQLEMNKI